MAQITFFIDLGTLLAAVLDDSLSAIFGDSLSSALAGDIFTSISTLLTAGNSFLSSTKNISSAFAISGSDFLSFVANSIGFASTISGDGLLSPITSDIDFESAVSDSSFFSLVDNNGFLSFIANSASSFASLLILSLSNILSHIYCFFLAFLATLFIDFAIPITRKRLFDKAFIKKRPLALT